MYRLYFSYIGKVDFFTVRYTQQCFPKCVCFYAVKIVLVRRMLATRFVMSL
jgi:hypothetical protein